MDEDEFWDTVGLLDRDRGGDDVAAAEPLVAYLAALPNGELFAFDDALAEHLRALDRRDVAERVFGLATASSPASSWGGVARASRAGRIATRAPSRGSRHFPPARASRSSCSSR